MNRIFRYLFFQITRPKTMALVGKSGTGKSFRSKIVADQYHCQLIIDDGLLIKGDHIVAGRSAKKAHNMLGAVRLAVFGDDDHQNEVVRALRQEKYRKILIIGTSDKMIFKICCRLALPQPEKILHIEDIATKAEIEAAMRSRYAEGKHVIPVPSIEVTRKYPQIVYDSLKVFLKKRKNPVIRVPREYEKTIVRPEFSKYTKTRISDVALKQMVTQSLSELDTQLQVVSLSSHVRQEGYDIFVVLRMPMQHQMTTTLTELQEFIADSLERNGSIFISSVSIEIEEWG